jgi:hypothetical protein
MVAEGVVMAIMHPGIAAGSATLAGIILFKSNMFSLEHHCSVVLYWISALFIILSLVAFADAQCNLVIAWGILSIHALKEHRVHYDYMLNHIVLFNSIVLFIL